MLPCRAGQSIVRERLSWNELELKLTSFCSKAWAAVGLWASWSQIFPTIHWLPTQGHLDEMTFSEVDGCGIFITHSGCKGAGDKD